MNDRHCRLCDLPASRWDGNPGRWPIEAKPGEVYHLLCVQRLMQEHRRYRETLELIVAEGHEWEEGLARAALGLSAAEARGEVMARQSKHEPAGTCANCASLLRDIHLQLDWTLGNLEEARQRQHRDDEEWWERVTMLLQDLLVGHELRQHRDDEEWWERVTMRLQDLLAGHELRQHSSPPHQ